MASKLGPHAINPTAEALAWSRCASIVKTIDITEPLRVAPDNAVRVFRHYFGNQDIRRSGADIASEVLTALGSYRHPRLYVELYNEAGASAYKEQARQIREAAPALHAAGVKLCGPCWGTGDYGETEWRYLVDNTRGALDALAVHAYWSPQYGQTEWNAYRYRKFWRAGDPPVILSEVGEDVVRDAPGGGWVGAGGWRKNNTLSAAYVAELKAYDLELAKDAYVLGATVFAAGAPNWKDYETDGLGLEKVFTGGIPTPAPAPTPIPAPTKGATPMPHLWLALTPSNQAYNRWSNTDELRQMGAFADAMAVVANRRDAITCKVFAGAPETDTETNPMLHAQLDRAYGWLNTAPPGTLTVGLGLHTDSGTTVQVGGYWGNAAITQRLAVALREQLRLFFTGAQLRGANYEANGYQQWTRAYGRHCPVILELGSHQVPAMVAQLANNPSRLATMLTDALLVFFALPATLKPAPVIAPPAPAPVDKTTDALNGLAYYIAAAQSASNLAAAKTAADAAWNKMAALKTAIGR